MSFEVLSSPTGDISQSYLVCKYNTSVTESDEESHECTSSDFAASDDVPQHAVFQFVILAKLLDSKLYATCLESLLLPGYNASISVRPKPITTSTPPEIVAEALPKRQYVFIIALVLASALLGALVLVLCACICIKYQKYFQQQPQNSSSYNQRYNSYQSNNSTPRTPPDIELAEHLLKKEKELNGMKSQAAIKNGTLKNGQANSDK